MDDDLLQRARKLAGDELEAWGEESEWTLMTAALVGRVESLATDNRRLRAACEAVLEFYGSHEAFGDFATLGRAALAFDPVAKAAREALAPAAAGGEGT